MQTMPEGCKRPLLYYTPSGRYPLKGPLVLKQAQNAKKVVVETSHSVSWFRVCVDFQVLMTFGFKEAQEQTPATLMTLLIRVCHGGLLLELSRGLAKLRNNLAPNEEGRAAWKLLYRDHSRDAFSILGLWKRQWKLL